MPTEFTQKGYIELWQDGLLVSKHTREREAVEKALALAEPLETEVIFEIRFPPVIMKKSPHVKNPTPGQPGDTTPPATPTGFSATPTGASTVNLTWTVNTDDTVSYIIRRSLTSNIAADGTDIVTKSGIASNSHTDSGLTPGTLYYYNIRAADLAGNNSPVSASATALTSASGTSPEYVGDDNYYPGQNTFFDLRMSYIWRDAESNPITYSIVSGSLPTGLALNSNPARIDGVPTTLGQSTSVVIQASDGLSTPTQKTLNFYVQTNAQPIWTVGNNYQLADVDADTGTTIDFDNYAIDFEADPLEFTLVSQSKNGVPGSYGITLDVSSGVLTVPTGLAPDQYTVVVDLSEAVTTTGDLPSLTLTGGGSGKPWTFGQPFKKGAANYVTANGPTSFQADIRNRWDDDSIKFAVLSGIGGTTATLSAAASDPGGTALTLAQMRAALTGTNTITVGAQTVTLSTMLGGTPHTTVHAGPVMANWIFRQALTVGTDLSLWVDVRYYSNGNIELFPWVENAYLRTVSPVNHVATCSVVVNGVTTSLGSIDFKARTRIPLLSGALSYWHGTNPAITPVHDSAYLKATKLVPNYSVTLSPTLTSGLTTSYTPNSRAGYPSDMGAAGGSGSWEGTPSIWYAQSPSASSYAAACVWGLSAGSWSVHYRSGTTFEPFTFTAEPNTSFASSPPAAVAGGSNGTYAGSHAPGFPFLPYLITGRWWFLDELQFIANYHFLDYQSSERFGADAIANPANAGSQRFAAWTLRSYAQALAALPDTHARRTELIAAWEANCQYWRNKFVDGVAYKSSTWTAVSPQGMVLGYEYFVQGSAYWSRGFMMSYLPVVWGAAWDYELPLSVGGAANHQTVRDRMYLHAVGLAGKLSGSGYNWRHLTTYDYPVSSGYLSGFLTFAQSHAEMKAVFGWTAESDNDADGLNLFQHSGETTLTNASGLPYGSSAAAGVALAVDHGYTGASAAWSRITGASNYTASLVAFHNGESPIFAMVPR